MAGRKRQEGRVNRVKGKRREAGTLEMNLVQLVCVVDDVREVAVISLFLKLAHN
jgi:hypothetical protein